MSGHCPNVLYEIPGSLRACSGEAGHDGECVFDRTPSQEELVRRAATWSVPVPDPTNERIKELEREYVLERNRVYRYRTALKQMARCIKKWKVSFKYESKKVSTLEAEVKEWREIGGPFIRNAMWVWVKLDEWDGGEIEIGFHRCASCFGLKPGEETELRWRAVLEHEIPSDEMERERHIGQYKLCLPKYEGHAPDCKLARLLEKP